MRFFGSLFLFPLLAVTNALATTAPPLKTRKAFRPLFASAVSYDERSPSSAGVVQRSSWFSPANTTDPQLVPNTANLPSSRIGGWKSNVNFPSLKVVLSRWLATYMRLLKEKPFITKATSAAVVQAIGDASSQRLFALLAGERLVYDYSRTFCFMLTGFFYKAPTLHTMYSAYARFGERMQKKHNLTDNQRISVELALDQSIGVFIFYPLYFYAYELCTAVAYMRVPDFAAITANGLGNILSAIKAQYALWPLSQLISFRFIPESLRVMHTSVVSIVWNIFFCAVVSRR